MNKPKARNREPILDYHEVISYIEEKYNIDTRDYANKYKEGGHFEQYQEKTGDLMPLDGHYPDEPGRQFRTYRDGKMVKCTKEEHDADFKLIYEHFKRYEEWCKENPEPPYLDYWHWLLANGFDEEHLNGTEQTIKVKEILSGISEWDDDGYKPAPDWVKDITQKIYDEYKDSLNMEGNLDVWVEW